MDELVINAKSTGRCGGWFGSLPVVPEGCKASPLLGEKGCETNGFNYFDKIAFWKTPIAEGASLFPTVAGRRITLPLWAVANFAGVLYDVRSGV